MMMLLAGEMCIRDRFDPTPILAPFFSLFFAFCMGAAGYGLVLIALGFILKRKMYKSMKGMMNLVITLGIFCLLYTSCWKVKRRCHRKRSIELKPQ